MYFENEHFLLYQHTFIDSMCSFTLIDVMGLEHLYSYWQGLGGDCNWENDLFLGVVSLNNFPENPDGSMSSVHIYQESWRIKNIEIYVLNLFYEILNKYLRNLSFLRSFFNSQTHVFEHFHYTVIVLLILKKISFYK